MDDLTNTTLYADIKSILEEARNRVYSAANSAMVVAYWNIGKLLFEASGENERSAYGKNLLGTISKQLTEEFGKGFTEANLRNMRQFFLTFPNCNALRSELNWTQYRMLMAIQGKLVEQRPEEGTGEELYRQIQEEKQALLKAGKIKKEKPLPEIAEDEKPFDILNGWKWVRLSHIAEAIVDCPHSTPTYLRQSTEYCIYPEWLKYKVSVSSRMNTVKRVDLDYKKYYLNDPDSEEILDTPLDTLSLVTMETWAMGMIRKYDMSYKQYNSMALILRQVMDYLVKLEKLPDNRFRKIKLPTKCFRRSSCKKKQTDSQIFYKDELVQIIAYANEQADAQLDETFLAIPLMTCLGLRISECLGLSFSDFDESTNTVYINKSFAVVDEMLPDGTWAPRRYEVMDYLKQNADPREVLANDECFEIVKHIRKILLKKGIIRDLLFVTDTPNNIEMKLYRICDALGIRRRSPHKLRKTYVSNLLNNGFDLDFVRAQVGHQDPRTTLNSYVFTTTRNEEKIARLNEVI